ncbi:hypothetical protein CcCBS67573_g06407 [Chytriomyces confervae]|uniref:EF-hand domain-containing protein n=1 Tax=Chytriomyces confervae TaxID=246404 RepID=A0A507F3U3_9FUNG|nr:hypothetical protein HDU80_005874 [Chytriomyces hyalinus]TPX70782.1 hypothetical protein CcCBS67573_g06407 [Chytriomyces confervae]
MGKNKSGAEKRRQAKAKVEAAEAQANMIPMTPAQAAAYMIRQQKDQERREKEASGMALVEQAELAIKSVGKTKRAPLLTADDALRANVATALLEIFARFDDDNDGALNRLELERFAVATNGEKFEEAAIDELKKSFNCNADGNLTRTGFLEMYQLQTLSDPNETWKDLIKHGYSIDVKLVNRATGSANINYARQDISKPATA